MGLSKPTEPWGEFWFTVSFDGPPRIIVVLGQGMGQKALASCTEEACLLVTNTSGKQCGLRMASSSGKIIPCSCQGHGGRGVWAGCHVI